MKELINGIKDIQQET